MPEKDSVKVPTHDAQGLALAVEWGFRAAEKGWNLERTLQEFRKVMSDGR